MVRTIKGFSSPADLSKGPPNPGGGGGEYFRGGLEQDVDAAFMKSEIGTKKVGSQPR